MDTIRTVCALGSLLTVLTRSGPVVAGQGVGDLCQKNSDCNSGYCYQYPSSCTTEICGENYCVGNSPQITIQTQRNFFLTAENGGGLSGSDAAMNTNRTQQLSWETFTCVPLGFSQFALKTVDGQWVTATWGGGVGGPDADPWEIQSNRTQALSWETFTLVTSNAGPNTSSFSCALKSTNGSFVTAVNGGGYGNSDVANKFPIHTNATWAVPGPWEIFKFNFQ
jgi:hypothetical protein